MENVNYQNENIETKKNTRYNWLINYIPELIRKTLSGFQDKIVIFFKTNTPDYGKQTMYKRRKKLSKPNTKKIEENINTSIRNLFKIKKNKVIKERIIIDIRTLCEQEDEYYKPIRVGNFWNNKYIEYESNGGINKNLSVKVYTKLNLTLGHNN